MSASEIEQSSSQSNVALISDSRFPIVALAPPISDQSAHFCVVSKNYGSKSHHEMGFFGKGAFR
jgi:hypothetical protein